MKPSKLLYIYHIPKKHSKINKTTSEPLVEVPCLSQEYEDGNNY